MKRAALPRPDRQSFPSTIEAKFMLDGAGIDLDFDVSSNFELAEIGDEVFLVAFGEVVGWYTRGRDGEMSVIAIGGSSIGQVWCGKEPPRYVPKCGVMWFPRAEFRPVGGWEPHRLRVGDLFSRTEVDTPGIYLGPRVEQSASAQFYFPNRIGKWDVIARVIPYGLIIFGEVLA